MKSFLPFTGKSSFHEMNIKHVLGYIAAAGAICWVCTFKIMDRDFWWHITAGKILLEQGSMILTDPFAYTRAGLPYLATHEWLAQIALHLIYSTAGSTGIILFRGIVACTCVGLLVSLADRFRYVYLLLGVWAIVITKGSFLERPQLFTFLFFAAFIVLAFRFLDAESLRKRLWIAAMFIVLELLWVNMHGGAALLGCAVVTFLFLQTATQILTRYRSTEDVRTAMLLLGTLVCMSVALVSPPNGLGTLTYLSQLMNDKTIAFIAEWQPRTWGLYLKELWPFFLLSFTALITGRRHWIFNTLLLCATAYLSRQAFRHEILFVFASIATCFYQFDQNDWLSTQLSKLKRYPRTFAVVTSILVLLLVQTAASRSFWFERQDNLFGFGQFDLARGAYDFVEREHITGNMFNTYGIGGYLIYRGYPDRKIFIDGRNVDYGFDFMAHTYAAGLDADRWEELEHQYDITYAIVDYDAIKLDGRLPYSVVLDTDPDWVLVYVDDWTAVYLKRVPANKEIIDRLGFKHVTVTDVQFHNEFAGVTESNNAEVIRELRRIRQASPEGIKATLALAKIALRDNHPDEVETLIASARVVRPADPEPLAVLAGMYVQKQDWQKAAQAFTSMLSLAGDNYPDIDYAFIATVYEKANDPLRAWYYRLGSDVASMPSTMPSNASGSTLQKDPAFSVNPAVDAQMFNDQGVAQAEAGQIVEAEESFKTSLKINPSSVEAWNNLCAFYVSQKRNVEAIDACTHATAIDMLFADTHYNLALAYYQNGSMKEAEKEALEAKKLGREQESNQLLLLIRQ